MRSAPGLLEVARHGPRLRRVLMRRLGRDADAADLLQDVYVAALEGMGRLRDPRALPAWLAQIAVNIARAHIRERKRERARLEVLTSGDTTTTRDPFAASPTQVPFEVQQLLQKLPANERAATALRFLADYELTDVAAACHVSLPTVKRRLASARRRLRRHASG